VSSVLER